MPPASPKPRIAPNCCPKCESPVDAAPQVQGGDVACTICSFQLRIWSVADGLQVFGQRAAERTIALTAEKLAVAAAKVKPTNGFQELGADSLDVADILMELEGELKINIGSDLADHVRSVGDLIRAVDLALLERKG